MNSKVAGVHSMTGYGTVTRDHELGRLTVELRSVNSRYLDIAFRLPDDLRALEPPIREALQARLVRGKVDVRASVQHRAAAKAEVVLRSEALDALAAAQADVRRRFPDAQPMTVADVLRFPGVVDDPQPDPAQWAGAFRPLIGAAIDELVASRAREGARLADTIRQRASSMSEIVAGLKPRAPQLVEEFGQKLTERLREAAGGALQGTLVPLEETMARIRQEVSVYGIRVDVAEELARLEIHVAELLRIVDGGGQVGKRLDFLMQELNREANTLGSKAAGVEVTQASVELKLLIEQVREQVQNLE
jgi:uncharacterized protein (TIGR00255 family)